VSLSKFRENTLADNSGRAMWLHHINCWPGPQISVLALPQPLLKLVDGVGNLLGLTLPNALPEVLIMTISLLEDIEAAALQLAPTERAHLAERLLLSLDEDDEVLATWVAEAERRGNAFDRGEMNAIDFDQAIAQARARLANRRAA